MMIIVIVTTLPSFSTYSMQSFSSRTRSTNKVTSTTLSSSSVPTVPERLSSLIYVPTRPVTVPLHLLLVQPPSVYSSNLDKPLYKTSDTVTYRESKRKGQERKNFLSGKIGKFDISSYLKSCEFYDKFTVVTD